MPDTGCWIPDAEVWGLKRGLNGHGKLTMRELVFDQMVERGLDDVRNDRVISNIMLFKIVKNYLYYIISSIFLLKIHI
jgi:hypothetical protein